MVGDVLSFPVRAKKGSLVSWWPFVSDQGKTRPEVRVLSHLVSFPHQDYSGKVLTNSCRRYKSSVKFLGTKTIDMICWGAVHTV